MTEEIINNSKETKIADNEKATQLLFNVYYDSGYSGLIEGLFVNEFKISQVSESVIEFWRKSLEDHSGSSKEELLINRAEDIAQYETQRIMDILWNLTQDGVSKDSQLPGDVYRRLEDEEKNQILETVPSDKRFFVEKISIGEYPEDELEYRSYSPQVNQLRDIPDGYKFQSGRPQELHMCREYYRHSATIDSKTALAEAAKAAADRMLWSKKSPGAMEVVKQAINNWSNQEAA